MDGAALLACALIILLIGWLLYVGTAAQRILVAGGFLILVGMGAWWYIASPEVRDLAAPKDDQRLKAKPVSLPQANRDEGYLTAKSCQDCHPEQYSSWNATYHRTMTQEANEESVIPSFDDVTLESRGRRYRLFRKDEEFWVETIDPAAEVQSFLEKQQKNVEQLPRVERQIVMTTGSHWHQTYWMQNPNGMFIQFPWVYHIDTGRWVFRIDSFLRPPSNKVTFNIWNLHCLGCHSTGGEPRLNPQTKTMHSVADLGISCEACHGPGEAHAELMTSTNPDQVSDLQIFNPKHATPQAASQACGQCHSISRVHDHQTWYRDGNAYHPGNDQFEAVREILLHGDDVMLESEHFGKQIKSGFWPDGTVRTGGREYNGMIISDCFTHGNEAEQIQCMSCHSLHSYESPAKLMGHFERKNRMCTQCHTEPEYTSRLSEHTHHKLGSDGSRCVNCHMPHTSYALFRATRSHRIASPQVRSGERGSKPNACNLCHLDQTKQWTADHLTEWYRQRPVKTTAEEQEIATGLLWALKGDAAQQACVAWHLGWEASRNACEKNWQPHVLSEMLQDDYSAVRYIAHRSLKNYPGYDEIPYQFDDRAEQRERGRRAVLERWKRDVPKKLNAPQLLLDGPDGRMTSRIEQLLDSQDKTPISLVE